MSDNKLAKTIFDAALFGTVFFAVERLLKLAHDPKQILSQLEDCEKNLLQCKKELLRCKKEHLQCAKEHLQCLKELSQCEKGIVDMN